MYHVLIAAVILSDQLIKHFIRAGLSPGESIPVINGALHITHVTNSGGAFGILQGQTWLLAVVTAALIFFIAAYIQKNRKSGHPVFLLSLSLVCAGGAGNLIDRIWRGEVTDFIDFRIFPVFNLADISVTCGCGLLLLTMIFLERKERVENKSGENEQ